MEFFNNIGYIKYTIRHKLQIFKMWRMFNTKVSLWRVLMHDMDKLFMYSYMDKEVASNEHRNHAKHHNINTDNDFYEAYLDWASARYTKLDKPLDAIETAEKYFPDLYNKSIEHYKNVKFK